MKIYFTEEFRKILNSSDKFVELGKFKLGMYPTKVKSFSEVDLNYLRIVEQQRSPGEGYYQFNSIYSDSTLIMSVIVPDYDQGLLREDYKIIYGMYKDLLSSTENSTGDDAKLAFILVSDYYINDKSEIEVPYLRLGLTRNIITINNFNPKCTFELSCEDDTKFLEGPGLEKYYNLYLYEEDSNKKGFISLNSYKSYLLEKRTQDSYDHLETTYINKFGIKIY